MFTGIIRELGTVVEAQRRGALRHLAVQAPTVASLVTPRESVAVNGVCLSVVRIRQGILVFDLIRETQRLTTLAELHAADRVNLEPSLSLIDRLNGHLLLGHVDGMGTIVKRHQRLGECVLEIRLTPVLHRFFVPKGPVAVDGVSLTVGQALGASTFSVHLIPETLRHTTLGSRIVGQRVNIELDYLAKLMWQFLRRRAHQTLT
jgi:riboflavin synthase